MNQLKEKKADKFGHEGMTRQEVINAARLYIGDTGLLDYVLKSMSNVIVGMEVMLFVMQSILPHPGILN